MSQVRVLHRLHWKCKCRCVLSRLRNKFSKFYKMSLVLNKIMLKILWLCYCGHSVEWCRYPTVKKFMFSR